MGGRAPGFNPRLTRPGRERDELKMKIHILAVGKIKDKMIGRKIEDYLGKPGKGLEVVVREVADGKGSAPEMKKQEAERILSALPARAYLAVLDERGEELDSLGFAELVKKRINAGIDLAFVIGGAYGLDEKVRLAGDKVVALSRLTFSHELARLVLAEQIYRSLSIIKGAPYHH
jgi:23S rRNA (pseudouridine1915-N3)-methyltransferase